MGAILSDDEVFGPAATSPTATKTPIVTLSDVEVFGKMPEKTPTVWERIKSRGTDVLNAVPAAGDMLIGAPANLVGRIKGAGAYVNEAYIQGGSRAEAEAAGTAASNLGHPALEAFKTPLQSAVKALTGKAPYDQTIVEEAMEAAAKGLSTATGGKLTPYDTSNIIGTVLDVLGVKGIKPVAQFGIDAALKTPKVESSAGARASYMEMLEEPPVERAPTNLTPKENAAWQKQREAATAEMTMTPERVKQIFTEAKRPAAKRIEVNETDLAKMFAAAKEKANTIISPEEIRPTPLATGTEKVATGLKWDVDAAEIDALKAAAKGEAPASDWSFWESGVGKKQGGAINPELAKEMAKIFVGTAAVAGPLAAAASYFWKEYKDDKAWREWLNDPLHKTPVPEPNDSTGREYTAMLDKGAAGLVVGAAAMGAIKPRGGNWHPDAGRVLAEKLYPKQSMLDQLPEAKRAPVFKFLKEQSDRMIASYLNKRAGTATDPLRDMEVPFGEGVKKWGELVDDSIGKAQAGALSVDSKYWKPFEGSEKIPPHEEIYGFDNFTGGEGRRGSADAIKSYISHMGDFARQNIPPEKLANYDFVRLAKETAANDARVAKEMDKAAAASTKDLPVYKDYGDEMKWVELKLPEKLTEEQGKRVRLVKRNEPVPETSHSKLDPDEPVYVAQDAKGKPITNNYTQEWALGRTPEEAYLAGKLAEEGNQLGHCVGGYCESVASSESKIYSLRDAKGKSHVTVEVGAKANRVFNRKPLPSEEIESILQIKGKQNRAPVAAYLPYVQDFVRSGKWGEVGDLEGTGLFDRDRIAFDRAVTENDTAAPALKTRHEAAKKYFGDRRYITEEEWKNYEEGKQLNKEAGSIDPKLLAGVAAAGGLAAYLLANPDESKEVVAAGMLAATKGKVTEGIKTLFHGADLALGRSTTRLTHIDPQLTRSLRDTELAASRAISDASDKIASFTTEVKKLPKAKQAVLEKAYRESDPHAVAEAIKGNPALVEGYRRVRQFLDETGDTLRGFGRFAKGITEHLPRVVKDHKGLLEKLGHQERTGLEMLLLNANKKMIVERGRELTDVERSVLINNFMQSTPATSHLPGFAKNRTIKMTDELAPFYYGMEDSLIHYAHAAVEDIATTRFFSQDLRTTKDGGKKFTNIDNSIGALTGRAMEEGRMTPKQAVEVQEILRARFGPGEKAPAGGIQDMRNLTGIGTLGQIGSGLIQTSESLLSVYHHSIRPAIEAAGIIARGKGIKPGEFGLANHVIEETIGKRPTGQALSAVLKVNLLAAFDQLGMKQNLTASYVKNKRLASTEKGRAALQEKWGEAYGAEMPALIKELQSSTVAKRGPLVDSLLYGELSDIRPTSRAEMPQLYNEHPNGRFLWQLKQFMLTQADILRRDAYDKIKTGEPRQIAVGMKNLTLYAAALAVVTVPADAIKNWVMGREFDFDKIDYVENIARNFGLSRYGMDKVGSSDKPGKMTAEVAASMVTPPVFSVGKTLAEGVDDPKKLVPLIPLAGRAYYNRELGGNEAYLRSQAIQKRIAARDERERDNPALKDARIERQKRKKAAIDEKLRRAQ